MYNILTIKILVHLVHNFVHFFDGDTRIQGFIQVRSSVIN